VLLIILVGIGLRRKDIESAYFSLVISVFCFTFSIFPFLSFSRLFLGNFSSNIAFSLVFLFLVCLFLNDNDNTITPWTESRFSSLPTYPPTSPSCPSAYLLAYSLPSHLIPILPLAVFQRICFIITKN